jgi:hypothetical protein
MISQTNEQNGYGLVFTVFTILGVNYLEEITNLRAFYLELHWYVD